MTSQPPVGEPEQQWQQPAFRPENPPDGAPLEGQLYSGSPHAEMVPRPVALPPSVAETVMRTVSGLMWPVMFLLAIMGKIPWWPAIIILLISNVVFENIRRHLRAQRRAIAARQDPIDTTDEGLR